MIYLCSIKETTRELTINRELSTSVKMTSTQLLTYFELNGKHSLEFVEKYEIMEMDALTGEITTLLYHETGLHMER